MAVILVVEDNVFIREVAEMIIQDLGHTTLAASDLEEAIALLNSDQPIDALFTDIYLKSRVMGGCDLASQAMLIRPGLRVLYTTGNAVTEAMRSLFMAGTHFLSKPYSPAQLESSVGGMLAA